MPGEKPTYTNGVGVCMEVGKPGHDLFKGDDVAVEKGFVLADRLAGQEVASWWHRVDLLKEGFASLRQSVKPAILIAVIHHLIFPDRGGPKLELLSKSP